MILLDEIESIEEFNEELSEEYLFTLNMLKGQCYRRIGIIGML